MTDDFDRYTFADRWFQRFFIFHHFLDADRQVTSVFFF